MPTQRWSRNCDLDSDVGLSCPGLECRVRSFPAGGCPPGDSSPARSSPSAQTLPGARGTSQPALSERERQLKRRWCGSRMRAGALWSGSCRDDFAERAFHIVEGVALAIQDVQLANWQAPQNDSRGRDSAPLSYVRYGMNRNRHLCRFREARGSL